MQQKPQVREHIYLHEPMTQTHVLPVKNLAAMLRRRKVVTGILVLPLLLVALGDEHYASLLRDERKCLSALVAKAGVENPYELLTLNPYEYTVCKVLHREWGMLERVFVYPAHLIREWL